MFDRHGSVWIGKHVLLVKIVALVAGKLVGTELLGWF